MNGASRASFAIEKPGRTRRNLWDTGLMSLSGRPSPLYRSFVGQRRSLSR